MRFKARVRVRVWVRVWVRVLACYECILVRAKLKV